MGRSISASPVQNSLFLTAGAAIINEALLEMDSTLDVEDELFDATNLLCVEGIDFNSIMEGLSTVQIFRSSYKDKALN